MFRIGNLEIDFANLDQWPTIAPAMAAIAVLTAILYATERKLIKPHIGLLLTALRFALVAVLAAALLDLRIRVVEDENEGVRRRLVVAIDTSWSMDLPDAAMSDVSRLRAADAAGMLPAGTRSVRLESLGDLAGVADAALTGLNDDLAKLAESLSEPNARLDGPHPRAVSAEGQLRLLDSALKQLRARIDAAAAPEAGLSPAHREVLAAGRDGALAKAAGALSAAQSLPLAADTMLSRQEAGNLGVLPDEYRGFLKTHDPAKIAGEVRAMRAKFVETADRIDADVIAGGGTSLQEILAKTAELTRRERVRRTVAREQASLLEKLDQQYALRVVLFDKEPVELDAKTALERLKAEPTAPVTYAKLGEFLKKRMENPRDNSLLNPAVTDFEPLLRSAARPRETAAGGPAVSLRDYARTVAGIVVFTDGINNPPLGRRTGAEAGALRTLAGRLGMPIIGVSAGYTADPGSGPTKLPPDIRIVSVEEPRSVFLKSEAEVWVNYEAVGVDEGRPLSFTLTRDGKPVADGTRTVAAERFGRISFKLDTQTVGTSEYRVSVAPVQGESIETNNSRSFNVGVTDSKLRVLVVDEEAGWEWRFVKDTLERDKERLQVDTVVFSPGELAGSRDQRDAAGNLKPWGVYPVETEDLFKYDVVYLGDLDPRGRFFRDESYVENLRKYVQQRGGSLIIAPGKRYMSARRSLPDRLREDFEALLPFSLPAVDDPRAAPDDGASARTPLYLRPSIEGERNPVCRLAGEREDNGEIWRSFPPVYYRLPVDELKPAASVVMTVRMPDGDKPADDPQRREWERRNPVAALHRSGLGRVMGFSISSTWRLRNKVGDRFHGRLWGQLIRWAAPGGWPVGNEFVQIRAEKFKFENGEAVTADVRFIDREGKAVENINPELIAYVGDPTGKVVAERAKLEYVKDSGGVWRAEFRNLRDGRFQLVPALAKGDVPPDAAWTLPERGLNVEVGNPGGGGASLPPETQNELTRLTRDPNDPADVLNTLAASSGGLVLDLHSADALPELLSAMEKPIDHLRRRAEEVGVRWGLWILLTLFVLIVSTEWIVRKSVGLI
jgi:hypothetical protein